MGRRSVAGTCRCANWDYHIYPDFYFPAKLEVMDLLKKRKKGGHIDIYFCFYQKVMVQFKQEWAGRWMQCIETLSIDC